jgi:hypothetical protein
LDDAFKIADKCLERYIFDNPIGESVATLIIPDQLVICGKFMKQSAPDRALPIIFEMIEPIGCLDQ